jgi:hypothetical protein
VATAFGYRYMAWDFDGNDGLFSDLNISGPHVGIRLPFQPAGLAQLVIKGMAPAHRQGVA